jgi:hypothetical protein
MKFPTKARHVPSRLATGAFILNSGITKLSADEQAASTVHGMATATYPALKRLDYRLFTKLVAAGEVALGAALVLPVVPTAVAATGLAAFSTGLLGDVPPYPGHAPAGQPAAHRERRCAGQRRLDVGHCGRFAHRRTHQPLATLT